MIVVVVVSLFALIFFVKRGLRRGISGEIRSLISIAIAILCLVLILLLKRSVQNHAFASVIVVGGALIILGTGWRIIRLILSPLKGFREIGVVRGIDGLLGAVAGILEGGAFFWVAMKIYEMIRSLLC